MKLHTAPQDKAIFGDVQEFGEFRIRNSAKAFSILSSGLYANKIRAIIRELSCNAIDSHKAVGKEQIPFELHLPTVLEPWFSLRDFGQGLDHNQVVNIYTTYFDSTKTDSDEFIGALGLGSKSPFSYTNNFTVTAIKDGIKGIYSAFINDSGIPSIVLMSSSETDEENGVEVKFAVHDNQDNYKFEYEAKYVFRWFDVRPTLTGKQIDFDSVQYVQKDIVPSVHQTSYRDSYAVMGNIPYPIEIPNSPTILGDLNNLLECSLIIDFKIGELDFQASREGLSYIPQTISAIKDKLQLLKDNLDLLLFTEANSIENFWERAKFLKDKSTEKLWLESVKTYVKTTDFPIFKYRHVETLTFNVKDLAEKYNIQLSVYEARYSYSKHVYNIRPAQVNECYVTNTQSWNITPDLANKIIINDITRGVLLRINHNFSIPKSGVSYYVIQAADSTKDIDLESFYKDIYNPPESNIYLASSLEKPPTVKKSTVSKDVTILKLESKNWRDTTKVWRDAGTVDEQSTDIIYYVPLNGFNMISNHYTSAKSLYDDAIMLANVLPITTNFYGVRKADLAKVESKSNWIKYEDYLRDSILNIDDRIFYGIALDEISNRRNDILLYYISQCDSIETLIDNPNSLFLQISKKLTGAKRISASRYQYEGILKTYGGNLKRIEELKTSLKNDARELANCYPMLQYLDSSVPLTELSKYINLIDKQKGE